MHPKKYKLLFSNLDQWFIDELAKHERANHTSIQAIISV